MRSQADGTEEAGGDARSDRVAQSAKLPPSLRKRLRIWAAFLDKEISEVVEEAVAVHLDKLEKDRARRHLPPLAPPDV